MFTGCIDPGRVLARIQGLHSEPWSRFRAAYLTKHPPSVKEDAAPSWVGFSHDSALLTTVANLLITELKSNGGKKAKRGDLVKTPMDAAKKHTFDSIEDFAKNFGR